MAEGASPLLYYWAAIQAVLGFPDWKNVIYGWQAVLPVALSAYFLGALPFGLMLARRAGHGDIRNIGSGNIGATNVLRTGNKQLAAATLLLDGGKGYLATAFAQIYLGPDIAFFAAIFVVVGHLFPLWLGFRGGKGVATSLGVLLGLSGAVGAAALATWLIVALIFRYSSLAALAALALAPVFAWYFGFPQAVGIGLILAVLVWIRHVPNIRRLLRGEESRIRLRQSAGSADTDH